VAQRLFPDRSMTYVEPPGGDGNDPLAHCSFESATLPSIQSGFDDVAVCVEAAASEKNENVTRAFLRAQTNLHVLRIDKKPKRVRIAESGRIALEQLRAIVDASCAHDFVASANVSSNKCGFPSWKLGVILIFEILQPLEVRTYS
jgi:hypothetical protein